MYSTFGALYIGKSGLDVQMKNIEVTGQNISHANDDTYAKRRVELTEGTAMDLGMNPPEPAQGMVGGGVRVNSVTSMRDDLVDNAARREKSDLAYWSEMKSYLRDIESVFNEPGLRSVREQLSLFLKSWENLSERPDDHILRSQVRETGRDLTLSMKNLDGRIESFKTDLDLLADAQVREINRLLYEVADLNDQIFRLEGGETRFPALDLRDARSKKLEVLSEMIKIDQCEFDNSQVMIEAGSRVLLRGSDVYEIRTERNEERNGLREILYGGVDADNYVREGAGHSQDETVALVILGSEYEKNTWDVEVTQMARSHSVTGRNAGVPITATNQELALFGIDSGSFTVNGTRIYFDAETTTLDDLAELVNKSVPEVQAEVADQGGSVYNLKITSLLTGTDNSLTFGHESDTSNLLDIDAGTGAGLGIIDSALGWNPATGNGILNLAANETVALNAAFTINDVGYSTSGNLIENFEEGITLSLKSVGETKIDTTPMVVGGELKATLELRDDVLVDLKKINDELAYTVLTEINKLHVAGFGLNGESHNQFFKSYRGGRDYDLTEGAAANISIDRSLESLDAVAASGGEIFPPSKVPVAIAEGNDEVADQMILLFNTEMMADNEETFVDFFATTVENVGFRAERANRRHVDQEALVYNTEVHRQEIMGVNLDEEMANLIMFQQSYQAAAKFISTFDQLMDTIINGLMR